MTTESQAARPVPFALRAFSLALLLLLVLWVYRPYLGARLVSGNDDNDGFTYHAVVADAIAQSRAGVFPAYVGQSAYRWNGGIYPQAQAPGLSLLAVAVDVATLRRLGGAGVLNAVVLLSALGGACCMYLALRGLDEGRPWLRAALALLYVTCPGVLGVLVRLDMYSTILVLPLLPIVWRALLALLGTGSRGAAVALGLSLAAVWSCHPPIALWATSVAGVIALAFASPRRWPWRALALAVLVFAIAEAWHFTTLLSLGGQQAGNVGLSAQPLLTLTAAMRRAIAENIRADLPGALLPVGWSPGAVTNGWPVPGHEAAFLPASWRVRAGTPYLQLGYALWGGLLVGLAAWLRGRGRRDGAPVAGALLLVLFLFPWPLLSDFLWGHLPFFYNITRIWPMQRFYVLLAALVPFCALPVLARLGLRPLVCVLLPALLWSTSEASKFGALGLRGRRDAGLERVECTLLKDKDLQMGARRLLPSFSDPALHLRLVSDDGERLLDNYAALLEEAPASPWTVAQVGWPDGEVGRLTLDVGTRQLALFRAPRGVKLAATGPGFWRVSPTAVLPLWTSQAEPQTVALRAFLPPGVASASVEWVLVPYRPEDLQLALESLIPLQVRLRDPAPASALETPRLYWPGYRATVDGQAAAVRPSSTGYTLIALPQGAREVRLEYVGTPAMRATFWLSALGWVLGLLAMAGTSRRS